MPILPWQFAAGNLLLAMLSDSRYHIRRLAYIRILQAKKVFCQGIRRFCVPKLNFNANDYHEMINWQDTPTAVPPLLVNVSEIDLKDILESPYEAEILRNIKRYPCHTQAVERVVKVVTESSLITANCNRRDGIIRATIKSRKEMPKFNTKKDF